MPAKPSWEGQIRKAKAPRVNRRPSRRRPTMGEAAVAPETQMALRTLAPRAPERMPKECLQGAIARKEIKRARQKRMVLPRMVLAQTLQRMVGRLPTNEVTQGSAETCRRPAGCRPRPYSSLGGSCC